MDKKKDEKKKTVVFPTQTMMFLRGFIGCYLIYLGVTLFQDESYIAPRPLVLICSVVFVLAGAVIAVWVVRTAIKGEYAGGKADISDEDDEDGIPQITEEGEEASDLEDGKIQVLDKQD